MLSFVCLAMSLSIPRLWLTCMYPSQKGILISLVWGIFWYICNSSKVWSCYFTSVSRIAEGCLSRIYPIFNLPLQVLVPAQGVLQQYNKPQGICAWGGDFSFPVWISPCSQTHREADAGAGTNCQGKTCRVRKQSLIFWTFLLVGVFLLCLLFFVCLVWVVFGCWLDFVVCLFVFLTCCYS